MRVLRQPDGSFAIVEPYAELNPSFKVQQSPTEGYILRIVRGLTQERWQIQAVSREGKHYRFSLYQPESEKKTTLHYTPLPETPDIPIGRWTEPEDTVIAFSSPFFVPGRFTAGLEKKFAPPADPPMPTQTARRQGTWSRWRGTMEGDRILTAFFCLQDSTLEPYFLKGTYYYEKIWKDLTLRPAQNDTLRTGNWDLREYIGRTREEWTGKFVGTMDYDYNFEGTWTDPQENTSLNFALEEEVLPFVLEDYRLWRKTKTQRLDTLYFPKLTALADTEVLRLFNDSLIQQQIRRWHQLSTSSITAVTGDYALLFANEQLISLSFSIYREEHKTEVRTLNFNWKTGKPLDLTVAYRVEEKAFQERLIALARQLLEQQNPAPQQLPSAYDELQRANFLRKNVRLLYFDPITYYHYTVYIPYEKLRVYERNQFTARYELNATASVTDE